MTPAWWVVDASNVFGARPDGWWRDRPRALAVLLDEIVRWCEHTGERVTVVADGHPTARVPEGVLYGVEVRYARSTARDAADDEIVRLVTAGPGGAGEELASPTVVTSDRGLRDRVTGLGASVEGARTFLDRLAAIPVRTSDRAVLAHFGIDESRLLGRGGEARVFALDGERVLRLPHPHVDAAALEDRRRLLAAIASPDPPAALPEVLDHVEIEGRTVVIERRLPGANAMEVLAARGTDRTAIVRHHLEVARRIAELPCPTDRFGEITGAGAIGAASFSEWGTARLAASLRAGGTPFEGLDPAALTEELAAALPVAEPDRPRLVHLDAFLGNMLATGDRITAILDFGPMSVGGPPDLDPLLAIAYLAPDITPTATDDDRAAARQWAAEAGLADAVGPAERWAAAYWAGAPDDARLRRWCMSILLGV